MRLLALDLSTRVGWSLWSGPADRAPRFGTFKIKKPFDPDDIAARTLPLRFWLRQMILVHRPDVVAFEAPLIMAPSTGAGGFTMASTIRLLAAIAGECETTAKECNVGRVLEVATASAKVALAGTARLGTEKKAAMVRAARARGWDVLDDHQADAGAVALVAFAHLGLTQAACALSDGAGVVPA